MLGLKKTNKIIESRSYNTGQGRWIYATVKENDFDLKENNYLAIVDIDGFKSFIQYFGENNSYECVEFRLKRQQIILERFKEKCRNFKSTCRKRNSSS